MGTFFTSDLHAGHDRIAQMRGYASAAEHDEAFADRYVARVRKRDIVFVLGDVSSGALRPGLDLLGRLPGRKRLIAGNHDQVHPMHSPRSGVVRAFGEVFESAQIAGQRTVAGELVLMSHFPYDGLPGEADRDVVRYRQWRLPDLGQWLLHGHTHMAHQRLHGRQLHVGLDAWDGEVVSEEQVAAIIAEARARAGE